MKDAPEDVRAPRPSLPAPRPASTHNVAHDAAGETNVLSKVLAAWFGPDAGRPGTHFEVALERTESGYGMRPLGNAPAPRSPDPTPYRICPSMAGRMNRAVDSRCPTLRGNMGANLTGVWWERSPFPPTSPSE